MEMWQTGERVEFDKLEEYLLQFGYPKNKLAITDHFYLPDETAYGYFCKKTKNYDHITAISYYGKHISYKRLKENIDFAAAGFSKIGIGVDDRVLLLLPNLPEAIYCQYGLNKIGAVPDFADPRCNSNLLKQYIQNEKIKTIVVADILYEGIIRPIERDLKDNYLIDTIIIVPVANSVHPLLKIVSRITTTSKKVLSETINIIYWNDLIKDSGSTIEAIPYEKDKIAIIVHSSGTTSAVPKAIPLTNENINAFVEKHEPTEFSAIPAGSKVLHILPFFAAYGSINTAHLSLCRGLHLIAIPEFHFEDMGVLVCKHKPYLLIGIPAWFAMMAKDERMGKKDLSFVRMVIAGGESISRGDELAINGFLKEHHAQCLLTKGHGMTELCGSASFTFSGHNNIGSVGSPFPYDKYVVLDENRKVMPLENGQVIGEAWIYSPSAYNGIFDGTRLSETVEINGFRFIASKDTMRITSSNELYFGERSDRTFTRFDGYKVRPANVEEIIMQNSNIMDCIVTWYHDSAKAGKMPIAHIVADRKLNITEKKVLVNDLVQQMASSDAITTRDIPTKWRFRDEIPLTPMQKKDYRRLIDEGLNGYEISVDIAESNLSIESITVIAPSDERL